MYALYCVDLGDIESAAPYISLLERDGLVRAKYAEGHIPEAARLTSKGLDCLSDYMGGGCWGKYFLAIYLACTLLYVCTMIISFVVR